MSKTTVVIPIYNVAPYLRQCLNSVASQTLKDIEVYCIDDCSTDESYSIAEEFADKDNRFHALKNEKNMGAAETRNRGLKLAKGDYIAFWDADDWYELNALEKCCSICDKTEADIAIYKYSQFDDTTGVSTLINLNIPGHILPRIKKVFSFEDFPNKIYDFFAPAPQVKVFRRKFILENDLHFQSLPSCNDVYFYMMGISLAKKIIYLDEPFLHYRYHRKGQTTFSRGKRPLTIYEALNAVRADLQHRKCFDRCQLAFREFASRTVYDAAGVLFAKFPDTQNYVLNFMRNEGWKSLGMDECKRTDFFTSVGWQKWNDMNNPSFTKLPRKYDTSVIARWGDIKIKDSTSRNDKVSLQKVIDDGTELPKHMDDENSDVYGSDKEYAHGLEDLANDDKSILVISHELTLTGAPLVLMSLMRAMKEKGFRVVVAAPINGPLRDVICKAGYTVVVNSLLSKVPLAQFRWNKKFKYIWINTAASAMRQLLKKPVNGNVFWWLHEPSFFYKNIKEVNIDLSGVKVLAVSSIATNAFYRWSGIDCHIRILPYGIPDIGGFSQWKNSRFVFAVIATIHPNKGQKIFLEAAKKVDGQAEFWLIGREADQLYGKEVRNVAQTLKDCRILGEKSREEMNIIYDRIDAVVVCSYEENISTVAIEAMQRGKAVIVSDANSCGVADYVEIGGAGLTVPSGDASRLAEAMSWAVRHRTEWQRMGINGRNIYEKIFSMDAFKTRINSVLESYDDIKCIDNNSKAKHYISLAKKKVFYVSLGVPLQFIKHKIKLYLKAGDMIVSDASSQIGRMVGDNVVMSSRIIDDLHEKPLFIVLGNDEVVRFRLLMSGFVENRDFFIVTL